LGKNRATACLSNQNDQSRTTTITAFCLFKQPAQLVVLEFHPDYAKKLENNMNLDGFEFYIEASAQSKVPLIQKGWNTRPSQVLLPGFI